MQNAKWFLISSILEAASYAPEYIYQKKIYDALVEVLKWDKNQIEKEFPIRMGSTYKRVDFLLKDECSTPVVAVEVKTPESHDTGVAQLGSYMNALEPQLKVGIVIKDKIYIFYDESNGRKLNDLSDAILSIPFNQNCSDGEYFTELFDFEKFNYDDLLSFCMRKKREIEQEKEKSLKIQEIIKLLASQDGNDIIKEAVVEKLKKLEAFIDIPVEVLMSIVDKLSIKMVLPENVPVAKNESVDNVRNEFVPNLRDGKSSIVRNNRNVPIEFVDGSSGEFVKFFYSQGYGFIHWILRDGSIRTDRWNNSNGTITEHNINNNIKSRPYYRENKGSMLKIAIYSQENLPNEYKL